jgi:hypothetical protein
VQHKIDTGDAQQIKKYPHRTPHALKPVVEEHIGEMLQRKKENNRAKYIFFGVAVLY